MSTDKGLGKEILDFIRDNGTADLKELIGLGSSRNSVIYHIKKFFEEGKIKAFVKGTGLNDEDLNYYISPGPYPREVKDLQGIITDMCDSRSDTCRLSYETFFNKCMEGGMSWEDTRRATYIIMSDFNPDLKNKLVFEMTYMAKVKAERSNEEHK